jgi:hypothetical protein
MEKIYNQEVFYKVIQEKEKIMKRIMDEKEEKKRETKRKKIALGGKPGMLMDSITGAVINELDENFKTLIPILERWALTKAQIVVIRTELDLVLA